MTDNELARLITNYRTLLEARTILKEANIDPKETNMALESIVSQINNSFSFLKLKVIK